MEPEQRVNETSMLGTASALACLMFQKNTVEKEDSAMGMLMVHSGLTAVLAASGQDVAPLLHGLVKMVWLSAGVLVAAASLHVFMQTPIERTETANIVG